MPDRRYEWIVKFSDIRETQSSERRIINKSHTYKDFKIQLVWKKTDDEGFMIGLRLTVPKFYERVRVNHCISIGNPNTSSKRDITAHTYSFDSGNNYGPGPFDFGGNSSMVSMDTMDDYVGLIPGNGSDLYIKFILTISGQSEELRETYMVKALYDGLVSSGQTSKIDDLKSEISNLTAQCEDHQGELEELQELLKKREEEIQTYSDEKKIILMDIESRTKENKKLSDEARSLNARVHDLEKNIANTDMITTLKKFDPDQVDLSGIDLEKMRDLMSRLLVLQSLVLQQINVVESCSKCKKKKRNCVSIECGHLVLCEKCFAKEDTCPTCSKPLISDTSTHGLVVKAT